MYLEHLEQTAPQLVKESLRTTVQKLMQVHLLPLLAWRSAYSSSPTTCTGSPDPHWNIISGAPLPAG